MSHMRLNSTMKLYYPNQNSAMKSIYYKKLCHTSDMDQNLIFCGLNI